MTIGLSTALRSARAQLLIDELNNGAIRFYDSPRPVTGAAIATQVLLATCDLFSPAGTVSDGVITLNVVDQSAQTTVAADVHWVRLVDSSGAFVADMSCGILGSGAEIVYDDVSIAIGSNLRILSGTILEGNA